MGQNQYLEIIMSSGLSKKQQQQKKEKQLNPI
jgi:hypothetical protein